jgi:hypothetical protein
MLLAQACFLQDDGCLHVHGQRTGHLSVGESDICGRHSSETMLAFRIATHCAVQPVHLMLVVLISHLFMHCIHFSSLVCLLLAPHPCLWLPAVLAAKPSCAHLPIALSCGTPAAPAFTSLPRVIIKWAGISSSVPRCPDDAAHSEAQDAASVPGSALSTKVALLHWTQTTGL